MDCRMQLKGSGGVGEGVYINDVNDFVYCYFSELYTS